MRLRYQAVVLIALAAIAAGTARRFLFAPGSIQAATATVAPGQGCNGVSTQAGTLITVQH